MTPSVTLRSALPRLVGMGILTLVYFGFATLGLQLAVPGTNATAIWVPTGIAMAAVLHFGMKVWPALFLGAFAANMMLLGSLGLPIGALLAASLATSLGNTAEALVAGFLIKRFSGTSNPFNRVNHVIGFLISGTILSTALSALVGTLVFCSVTGRWAVFQDMGAAWWVGDAVGALVVVPLLLTFHREDYRALPLATHREALLSAILAATFWFGICSLLPPLAFLFLPLLVLGAFRLGPFYASALVALLAVLATVGTLVGMGPFIVSGERHLALLLQQGFIGTLAITTLVLSSALRERHAMEARLALRNRLYQAQSEVNQAIARAESRGRLLSEACRLLVELGGFSKVWVGVKGPDPDLLVPECSAGFQDEGPEPIRWVDYLEGGRGLGGASVPPVIFTEDLDPSDFAAQLASARSRRDPIKWICSIRQSGFVTGALVACHADPDALSAVEAKVLQGLATDLGYALEALEAKKELQRAEHLHVEILDRVSDAFVALDKDWHYLFLNEQAAALFGRKPEDLIGKHIWTEFPEGVGQPFHENYERAMQEQVPVFFEEYYAPWDRWFENRVYPSQDGLSIFFHEITERRRVEASLRESEQRFSSIYETVADPIFHLAVEPHGRFRFISVNPAFLEVTGLSESMVVGQAVNDIVPEPSLTVVLDHYRKAIELKTVVSWVETSDYPTGQLIGEVRIAPVINDKGECTHLVGTVHDLTESKRAEAALTLKATQLTALNDLGHRLAISLDPRACALAALDGLMATTAPDVALFFLKKGDDLRLLDLRTSQGGVPPAEPTLHRLAHGLCALSTIEGSPLYSLDLVAEARCTPEECRQARVASFVALPLRSGDQVIGALGLGSTSPRDFQQEGTFIETLATQVATGLQNALLHQNLKNYSADLELRVHERTTLLREANEDLAKAIDRVQMADRAKSAFLAAMSHELRTPLNSVIGFTGVLLRGLAGNLLPQQEEPLRIVQRNGRHLLALINDVLDLSKIEAGEMSVGTAPFDLVKAMRETLESMAPSAAAKGLVLLEAFEVDTLPFSGDSRRVSQILFNLLSNAVKFTEQGSVTFRLTLAGGQARIAVQDTGPGIPEQDLPRLFREFEQLDAGLARRSEGTGLGLALSRRLARLMKGDILVESTLGQGTTFTLSLPLPSAKETP